MNHYIIAWKNAVERLRRIREDDEAFVNAGLQTDRRLARAKVAGIYVRYMIISNELTVCLDSIIHPQIRKLIKKMIMCTCGRVLELKNILINEDLSIYTPIIKELTIMKLPYEQFEFRVPRYFRDDRRSFLNEMNDKIDEINRRIENDDWSTIQEEVSELEQHSTSSQLISKDTLESDLDITKMIGNNQLEFIPLESRDISRELAIKFIQKHIRAKTDRILCNELLAAQRARENIISGKYVKPSKDKAQHAAKLIQRCWRFYRIMKVTNTRKQNQNILTGMHMSSNRPNLNVDQGLEDEIHAKQVEADIEFQKVINKVQQNFNERKKDKIIEDIEDELRAYIWTSFETCKHLPSWPSSKPIMFTNDDILGLPPIILSEVIVKQLNIPPMRYQSALKQRKPLGGSAIMQTGRWMTIEMGKILAALTIEFENKPKKEQNKLKKELEKKNKIEKEKQALIAKQKAILINEKKVLGVLPDRSDLTNWFNETLDEFDSDWIVNNGSEQVREDLIKSEIFAKSQVELRAMVDLTIEEELNRLRMAHAQDLKKKYKPPSKKSAKNKKQKKQKTKQLPNLEEIFELLVKNHMLRRSVTSKFNEFHGEVSCIAYEIREEPYDLDPPYGLGDIRQIIKELCVMGLIFPDLRTLKGIQCSRSLLIAGPEKSGKSMLLNAICTETGSLKIELNLKNVSENYPDPQKIIELVNIIIEFAKAYQPVVIEVDLADVPFHKKIPKELKIYSPKLMKILILKLLKMINKSDRILVVGKATSPWLTSQAKLMSVYETIVFTVPDYNSKYLFLYEILMRYSAVSREFPVTVLANMLAGYTRQEVADIVAEVMTNERVLVLRYKPLHPRDFIHAMARYPTREPDVSNAYHNWYIKYAPMSVKRTAQIKAKNAAVKKK